MCLIARHFEALGLPTLILGSALDILEAGRPPRAQFLDFPLGFETGPYKNKHMQLEIVREAIRGFDSFKSSGIRPLSFTWPEGWDLINTREKSSKDNDSRSPRNTEPQYQNEDDRLAAEKDS